MTDRAAICVCGHTYGCRCGRCTDCTSDFMDAALNSKARSEQFQETRDLRRRVEDLERKAKRKQRASTSTAGFVPAGHQTTPAHVTMTFTTLTTIRN